MNILKILTAAITVAALGAGAATAAQPPLSQNKYVNDRLIAARIADRIRRECPAYDARLIYAWNQARALKKYARQQGYSESQIDSFLKDRDEKRRIYAVAEDYLTRKGAAAGDAQSFCRVGQQEFDSNSYVATFLVPK